MMCWSARAGFAANVCIFAKIVLMYESGFLIPPLEICQVDANTTTPTDNFFCVCCFLKAFKIEYKIKRLRFICSEL